MKLVRTEEAVGHILCHDLTQIIKDVKKDAVFRKGHVVTKEDIPVLLSIGKEHLYVWEKKEGILHEDEGAEILRQITQGENLEASDPREGRINLRATVHGVLKLKRKELIAVNSLGEVMIATKRNHAFIKKGGAVAGMRVIPLVIEEAKLEAARKAAGPEPLCSILPIRQKKAAIIATGSEIYKGRIKDTFTPVVEEKLAAFGTETIIKRIVDDDPQMATEAILSAIDQGAEIVCCTGGMSVDPDDKTPLAIRNTGAEIISYGAPVLPGAMFLLSYYTKKSDAFSGAGAISVGDDRKQAEAAPDEKTIAGEGQAQAEAAPDENTIAREGQAQAEAAPDENTIAGVGQTNAEASADQKMHDADADRCIPIVGLPGCVMYAGTTIFDLILPRLLADDRVSAEDFAEMGEGGLL